MCVYFFFFFKQKTAYEIYQCDWSSDVCSSDLEMQSFWVKVNKCRSSPVTKIYKEKKYKTITYTNSRSDTEVVQYIISDQGHAWPGGKKPRIKADKPSKHLKATDLMWNFFRKHPKS